MHDDDIQASLPEGARYIFQIFREAKQEKPHETKAGLLVLPDKRLMILPTWPIPGIENVIAATGSMWAAVVLEGVGFKRSKAQAKRLRKLGIPPHVRDATDKKVTTITMLFESVEHGAITVFCTSEDGFEEVHTSRPSYGPAINFSGLLTSTTTVGDA